MVVQIAPGFLGPLDKRFVAFGPGAVFGTFPKGITFLGPLSNLAGKIGSTLAKGGQAGARAARSTSATAATPKVTNAIRTVSVLGKTRAGLNLSGRQITILGTGAFATTTAGILSIPSPSGETGIETIVEGAKDVAEDLGPGFEEISKFLRENGPIIALAIGGIVLIGLIK